MVEVVCEILGSKETRGLGSVELGVEGGSYVYHPICVGGLDIVGRIHECRDMALSCSLSECAEKILCVAFAFFLPLYSSSERNSV